MWTHIFDVFIRHAFLHDKPKNIKDMDNFPIKKVKETWSKMANKRS